MRAARRAADGAARTERVDQHVNASNAVCYPDAMNGLQPNFEWAVVVPELLVTDLTRSLRFWCDLCGFAVAYDRPEDRLAYLDRWGRQVMLEESMELGRRWITGSLDQPYGRGMNLQIGVEYVTPILAALEREGWPLYVKPEINWYRVGLKEVGVQQFLVQDPDGYLLRFLQPLGVR